MLAFTTSGRALSGRTIRAHMDNGMNRKRAESFLLIPASHYNI